MFVVISVFYVVIFVVISVFYVVILNRFYLFFIFTLELRCQHKEKLFSSVPC